MTIDELKRALVEVRDICAARECCEVCPFNNVWRKTSVCRLAAWESDELPEDWDVDDWKEDSNATD